MKHIFTLATLEFSLLMCKPWAVRDWSGLLMLLTDGFFVSGVLLLCVGGLCYVAERGVFNMLGYTLSSVLKKEKGESYYSYVTGKKAGRKWLSPVRDGTVMVGLSWAFAIMWQVFSV